MLEVARFYLEHTLVNVGISRFKDSDAIFVVDKDETWIAIIYLNDGEYETTFFNIEKNGDNPYKILKVIEFGNSSYGCDDLKQNLMVLIDQYSKYDSLYYDREWVET